MVVRPDQDPATDPPPITCCRSCPDTAVFIETGNTDAWIASDHTVEITR